MSSISCFTRQVPTAPSRQRLPRVQRMSFLIQSVNDASQCFGSYKMPVFPWEHHPSLSFGRSSFPEEAENLLVIQCGGAKQFSFLCTPPLSVERVMTSTTAAAPLVACFLASIHLACSSLCSRATMLFFSSRARFFLGPPIPVCWCLLSAPDEAGEVTSQFHVTD